MNKCKCVENITVPGGDEESISICFELEVLTDISRIANSDTNLGERLNLIISVIKERTGMDACSILLKDDEGENLILRATNGLNESLLNILSIPVGIGIAGWTAKEKKSVAVTDASSDSRFFSIPDTDEGKFKSVLSMPLIAGEKCIGVIYTQTYEPRTFIDNDIKLLSLIADQISGIIRNTQLYDKSRQNLSELLLVNEITRSINTTYNLDELLSSIVKRSTEAVSARGCVLWIVSEDILLPKAYYGIDPGLFNDNKIKVGTEAAGIVAKIGKHENIKNINLLSGEDFLKKIVNHSALLVPLTAKSEVIGVLCLTDKKTAYSTKFTNFSDHDYEVISMLGEQVAIAIDKAVVYDRLEKANKELEEKIKELFLLYDISVAMQSTVNLDKIIRIILSCVTVGDLFGFNRAILFLLNEKTHTLEGKMGLGPDSAEEANRIWKGIPKITNLVTWLISQENNAEKSGINFDKLSRELTIPVKRDFSVLTQTILEGKHFNIKDARNHPLVNQELRERLHSNSFATVPIIAQDQVLGVILVDNLFTGKEITDEDVQTLVRFVSHVGYALQNICLLNKLKNANKEILNIQNHLIQAVKHSALGELTAELAHELKNPLMIIGGFARRLTSNEELSRDEMVKYSAIIGKEVKRTEKILEEILVHSRFIPMTYTDCSINSIIGSLVSFYSLALNEKNINVVEKFSEETETISIDPNQIKQVLTNLIYNAMDAMPGGGTLYLKTEPNHAGIPGIFISVEDTGKGISEDVLNEVFNPFFTTKPDGSGLGLHLSKKIIEAHGGLIEIKSNETGRTSFRLFLPYNKKHYQNGGG